MELLELDMRWIFEAMLIGLALGIAVAALFYQIERHYWPEPMRVLSTVEALDRGWAYEFEE
jgi:hypothetical protein